MSLPLISGDTESILATEKATQWLHECLTTHDFCQYPDHASLPTRVVDLLPWKTKKDPILVDSKSLSISDNSTAYVCLSHCWGKAALIRTTKATIEHHKGGIPWTLLSKTFQDAIKITLDLGVRYIWIDSLCIIQDDETDWQVQAGQMASIYENCLFTIAATASADGSGGCYRKAPAEYAQVVTRSRTNREGRNFTASCRRAIQHPDTLIHAPDGYMVHAPLIDRAWVFQEHELSRRVLQFTATELMWECNSSLRCECGRVQPDRYQRKSQLVQARTAEELAFLGNEWRKRVVAYSCRMLTYGTDKLPALSGVAKQMQRHMSSVSTVRYLAGLWEHDLLEALTWISGTNPGGQNIAAYRAPSWSWASLEGILDYDDTYELNMNRSVARILEVHCVPAGLDPTGAVSGGCLKIAGPLIEVNLEYNPNENYDPREIRYHVTYGTYNDNRPQINPDYPYAEAGDLYMPSGETVFCLRLGSIRFKDRSGRLPDDNYKALLLRRSAKVQGSFERIGLFRNFGEDTAEGWFDDAPSVTVIIV
ncbi:hypothetical protein MMC24_004224 [Lignoscripta atroalba]|nr:hypothetical protein [Lignoscripta atroalba]